MSKNNSIESYTINPVLQAALASLDVQLEEELARYRRQQAGRPVTSPRGLGRNQTRKPLQLISLDSETQDNQQPASEMSNAAPEISIPLKLLDLKPEVVPIQENFSDVSKTSEPDNQTETGSGTGEIRVLPSNLNLADSSATETSESEQPPPRPPRAPLGGSLVHSAPAQTPPEDYLESSQQLLQSLEEEEGSNNSPEDLTNKMPNPLGVGLALFLLLCCASVAYTVYDPSILADLGLESFFGQSRLKTAQNPVPAPEDGSIPNIPNLASEEFPDVNRNTLSLLEASQTPTPSSVPPTSDLSKPTTTESEPSSNLNQPVARGSSNLSQVLLPPPLPPTVLPPVIVPPANNSNPVQEETQQSTPKLEASPTPESALASPIPTNDKYYYVLIDYDDEGTLDSAREIVPDAYVRNLPEGTKIQMGAFDTEADAESLVTRLQQEGISASIYRP
ncbi:MAG: SPOR domain-containing protein [Symploca sp. SIO2E9]|nr:SPOR domain-containing protein [Symploca sp. SIO2E9]